MFKKTAIAALVLGFSGAASAAMYAPAPAPACAAGNVTVPCERSAWDLGVDALYLRTADYNAFGNTGSASNLNNRPDYGWGFRLEGSYHFGTGNDVTLNWAHYDKRSFLGAATGWNSKSKFDVVNLELGQHIDVGEMVDMRFYGGLQWVDVTDHTTVAATGANNSNWKTTGFGPRAGLTTTYNFGNGFAVYGDGSVAFLAAEHEMTNGVAATVKVYGTALSGNANVGVAYTHAMAQGDLTARVGWGVTHINPNNAGFANGHGWSGFNFGLKWVGNA